jgi:hypothetical protein
MSTPDNPYAYPICVTPDFQHADQGMTLRDYFAGQALAGLIQGYAVAYGSPTNAPDEIVSEAYAFADIMLNERSKETGE